MKAPKRHFRGIMGRLTVACVMSMLCSCSPKLQKAIIGQWQEVDGPETIEFFKDGTITVAGGSMNATGNYKFVDKGRIKVELGGLGTLMGPFVAAISISGNELTLSMPDGQISKYKKGNPRLAKQGENTLVKKTGSRESDREPERIQSREEMCQAARTQISQFSVALDAFEIDVGRYPTTVEGLRALVEKPTSEANGWKQPYLRRGIPKDPWGNDYVYENSGKTYSLRSPGPDGQTGTSDDISSR